ncbi:MAG TPA: hypothetical protein VF483_12370 [Gemmatimonadaceae bacterium]
MFVFIRTFEEVRFNTDVADETEKAGSSGDIELRLCGRSVSGVLLLTHKTTTFAPARLLLMHSTDPAFSAVSASSV